MTADRQIRIEGYTAEELLAALDEQSEALLLSAQPAVFRIGSASILGQFAITGDKFTFYYLYSPLP